MRCLCGVGIVLWLSSPALAGPCAAPSDPFSNTQPRPSSGSVTVNWITQSNNAFATIILTDNCGNDISGLADFPMTKKLTPIPPFSIPHGTATFPVPAQAQLAGTSGPGQTPKFAKVDDYRMQLVDIGALMASLQAEAVFRDPANGNYVLANVFGTIAGIVGDYIPIDIPFMVADTNGVGSLYSLVDVSAYLGAPPAFSLGEMFTSINGESPDLPGMMFSTTPFTFTDVGGFIGTPFDGQLTVEGDVSASAVPEPPSWMVLVAALALLRSSLRHTMSALGRCC